MQQEMFEVQVPTALLQYNFRPEKVQTLVNEWLVLDLFTSDQISSGKAASLLKMSRRDFLDLLHRRHIAYLDYDRDELVDELFTVKNLRIEQEK